MESDGTCRRFSLTLAISIKVSEFLAQISIKAVRQTTENDPEQTTENTLGWPMMQLGWLS